MVASGERAGAGEPREGERERAGRDRPGRGEDHDDHDNDRDDDHDDDRRDDLERACRKQLEFLRKNCPQLLPQGPSKPGQVSAPLPIDVKRAGSLVSVAVQQAAAGSLARASGDRRKRTALPRSVIWTHGADSLLVLLDSVRISTDEGVVTVAVTVACDELMLTDHVRQARIEIDLVVGTPARPAGMLAATTLPRGPLVVVNRWADALIALAWQGMLDASAGIAAAAGSDTDGAPLVPTSWTATREGLSIGPQARHRFDRLVTGAGSR